MKKLLISLLLCLMIWTVVGKDFNADGRRVYYILENEESIRQVFSCSYDLKNPLIVGDKVEIIRSKWGTEIIQRVK